MMQGAVAPLRPASTCGGASRTVSAVITLQRPRVEGPPDALSVSRRKSPAGAPVYCFGAAMSVSLVLPMSLPPDWDAPPLV